MDTFQKLFLGSLAAMSLIGAFYAFANRKYLTGPDNDKVLKKIRVCGLIMFFGGAITFAWMFFLLAPGGPLENCCCHLTGTQEKIGITLM